MLQAILAAGALLCALQAVRVKRLLASALWLAGVSAITAALLYTLGAAEVAVIELSVGTGLVTVLFVFAIGIAGEDSGNARAPIPRPLAWLLVILAAVLLGIQALPIGGIVPSLSALQFGEMLWNKRALDVLVQTVLLFAGVVGILGLLSDARAPQPARAAQVEAQPVDTWSVESGAQHAQHAPEPRAPETPAPETPAPEVHA